jgi:hypothetical protein
MVMAFVAAAFESRAAVGLGQLDSVAIDLIDGADMDAVGADHFHMFADLAEVGHVGPLLSVSPVATRIAAQRMHAAQNRRLRKPGKVETAR